MIKRAFNQTIKGRNSILWPISCGHNLTLKPITGGRHIRQSSIYWSDIDLSVVGWTGENGISTPSASVRVDEIAGDGKFRAVFYPLPGTWNQRWLSWCQVVEFCEVYPEWLRTCGFANIFIVKKDENVSVNEKWPESNLAVAVIRHRPAGMSFRTYEFAYGHIWCAENAHRVISRIQNPTTEAT